MRHLVRRSGWLMVGLLAASGCVAPMYPGAAGLNAYGRRPYGPAVQLAPAVSPVGRWDAVMMLEPGTPIRVLTADGVVTAGDFVGATLSVLTLHSGSEATLAAESVVRVDRLAGASSAMRARRVGSGAAVGAGAVGVLGLLTGHVPPARIFAAGAIVGGYAQSQADALEPGPGTIYLAAHLQAARP